MEGELVQWPGDWVTTNANNSDITTIMTAKLYIYPVLYTYI